jgi:CYTH domain-containing protein
MLTLKFGRHELSRDEFEYPVPLADAHAMRVFAVGNVIAKTRHKVDVAGYLYEVDEFAGTLAGLVIAELEMPDDVADAHLPAWLGREITGEPAYYNAMLALRGRPESQP